MQFKMNSNFLKIRHVILYCKDINRAHTSICALIFFFGDYYKKYGYVDLSFHFHTMEYVDSFGAGW